MTTFLFDKIIFGPVSSRRLGASLGINLLPRTSKLCNFNCVYCECGETVTNKSDDTALPSAAIVKTALKKKLTEMRDDGTLPDTITFAGNGEPTMHPAFNQIINDTIEVRNSISPGIDIAVLTNGTMIHKPEIFSALKKIERNIVKLDAGIEQTCRMINRPVDHFDLRQLIANMKKFGDNLIIQSLFLKIKAGKVIVDNTTDKELEAWLGIISEVRPKLVMLYTFSRGTPSEGLEKVPYEKLMDIAKKVESLGIETQVSA